MISPLAFVDPAAKLGKNVTVQPFAYIEGDVEIGDDHRRPERHSRKCSCEPCYT